MRMKQLAFAIGLIGVAGMTGAYADDQAQEPQKVEKIEVTGSSIKRLAKEGALPVQTIKREEIEKLGVTNTEQLLTTISATSTSGANTTSMGAGLSTFGEATVSLRALGANRTLVLVNGRRLANYATDGTAVDINSIPVSAVERVEVLKDGASSIYGSDAVGGVINFILRHDYKGFETSAYLGSPTRSGGGSISKAGFAAGWGNDTYNLMLTGDISHETELFGRDRAYANHASSDPTNPNNPLYDNSATPTGRIGQWTLGVPGALQTGSGNLGNVNDPNTGGAGCQKGGNFFDANYGTCRFDPAGMVGLVPKIDRANIFAGGHFNVSPDLELYAEALYNHSETTQDEQPSPISPAFLLTDPAFKGSGIEQSIVLLPGSAFYPTAWLTANSPGDVGKPVSVSYRVTDAGGRSHKDKSDLYRFVAGAKGSIGSWDYDVAFSSSGSTVEEDTLGGYELQTKLVQSLNNCQCFDPTAATQSAATAALVRASVYNGMIVKSKLSYDGFDAKTSGSLLDLPAGPLQAAVGASVRRVKNDFTSSAAAQSGDVSGYGSAYIPYDKTRDESAVYAEFSAPIVKGLDADLAVRGDHFGGVGDTTNPKISFRWQPLKQLLLRASYGTGFRAPSLPELYTPAVQSTTAAFVDPLHPELGKQQWTQTSGGNPLLKPEKSRQDSVGFVLQPASTLSFGVDYYHIKMTNTIGAADPKTIVLLASQGNGVYQSLVTRAPSVGGVPGAITNINVVSANVGATDTDGYDVNIDWRKKFANVGTVSVSLNGTYVAKYDLTRPDGVVEQSVAKTLNPAGGVLFANGNGGIIQRWRHQLTAGVTNPTWNASITQNFQSGYQDGQDQGGTLQNVGAFSTYDTQVGYTGIKNLTLNFGLKNMFDRDPPSITNSQNYFQSGYDPTYYDPRGRFAYVSGSYKFF